MLVRFWDLEVVMRKQHRFGGRTWEYRGITRRAGHLFVALDNGTRLMVWPHEIERKGGIAAVLRGKARSLGFREELREELDDVDR